MATAPSKIATLPSQRQQMETRFVELMTELFQLDEAEALDFGLYRIIRRHNREIHAFLGEIVTDQETRALHGGRLAELLDTAFASLGHEAQADDKFRLKGHAKKIDGPGLFMRVQHLEQYDDTLESLDAEVGAGESGELLFHDPAFALRYRLDKTSRALYCGVDRFSSPFGYQLKRAGGGGEAQPCEVDLVESIPYLLGMDVIRLYREAQGVVVLGRNRRGQSVSVFFRDCAAQDSAHWVAGKLAQHPADRVYTNDPAGLSFEGCDSLEAVESVFALQFGRN